MRLKHSGSFRPGREGRYTIQVTNRGPTITSGVMTLVDTLPIGFSYVSGSGAGWSCTYSAPDVTCTRSLALGVNRVASLKLKVSVSPQASSVSYNRATVSFYGDRNPYNDSAIDLTNVLGGTGGTATPTPRGGATATRTPTVVFSPTLGSSPTPTMTRTASASPTVTLTPTPRPPDLKLIQQHSGSFRPNETGMYFFNVTNNGDGATYGPITLVDTLPSGMTLAEWGSDDGWNCSTVGQQMTCVRTTPLDANTLTVLWVTVDVDMSACGIASNIASVSTEGDLNPVNDAYEELTNVYSTDCPN